MLKSSVPDYSVDITKEILGENHPKTVTTIINLSTNLLRFKKHEEAFKLVNDCLKYLPKDHLDYRELTELKHEIDQESGSVRGFRPISQRNSNQSSKKKKRKDKKKRK